MCVVFEVATNVSTLLICLFANVLCVYLGSVFHSFWLASNIERNFANVK